MSLLLLVCILICVAGHTGLILVVKIGRDEFVCNGRAPFDDVEDFACLGWTVELATFIGLL